MDRARAYLFDALELGALGAFVAMIACCASAFGG
jgi:hypothetical protein